MPSARTRPCEEAAIQSIRVVRDCAASAKPWVLLATILASSIAYIDKSIVNVALPAIETDLATSAIVVQWLINAYTLSLSCLLLIGGAAGDQFGRRRLFIIGIGIFAAASLWCGMSPDVTQLISARVVQGVGAALLIPSSLAIIGATFAENERGKAIGTWAGFSALAAAAGPLLGGWIVDHFSWRWIFFVNPLLTMPTVWIALRHVPESRDPEAKPGLDWRGGLLVLIGLGSITYGLIALPTSQLGDSILLASLLLGVKRTSKFKSVTSANDPEATLTMPNRNGRYLRARCDPLIVALVFVLIVVLLPFAPGMARRNQISEIDSSVRRERCRRNRLTEAIVQAKPHDVETILKGCVERRGAFPGVLMARAVISQALERPIFPSWRCFCLTGWRVAHRNKCLSRNRKSPSS